MKTPSGTIALFWGLLAAMPPGWKSCDGTLGTPDLRNRFIRGAGIGLAPHLSGGFTFHDHDFTSDTHIHRQLPNASWSTGTGWLETFNPSVLTGITATATMLPPYMALIYIQKI